MASMGRDCSRTNIQSIERVVLPPTVQIAVLPLYRKAHAYIIPPTSKSTDTE